MQYKILRNAVSGSASDNGSDGQYSILNSLIMSWNKFFRSVLENYLNDCGNCSSSMKEFYRKKTKWTFPCSYPSYKMTFLWENNTEINQSWHNFNTIWSIKMFLKHSDTENSNLFHIFLLLGVKFWKMFSLIFLP